MKLEEILHETLTDIQKNHRMLQFSGKIQCEDLKGIFFMMLTVHKGAKWLRKENSLYKHVLDFIFATIYELALPSWLY
jgi:hypothetical protein